MYLYAKKIKKVVNVNSPQNKKVISSPKVLSKFSPVASMIKRSNSCHKTDHKTSKEKELPKHAVNKKSTFKNEEIGWDNAVDTKRNCCLIPISFL